MDYKKAIVDNFLIELKYFHTEQVYFILISLNFGNGFSSPVNLAKTFFSSELFEFEPFRFPDFENGEYCFEKVLEKINEYANIKKAEMD